MSNLSGYNFNAEEIEPSSFDPIPAGWYQAIISNSEMKATRDGYGEYLSLTLQVIEGQYENRLVFARLNLKNANEKSAINLFPWKLIQQLSLVCSRRVPEGQPLLNFDAVQPRALLGQFPEQMFRRVR